MPQFKAEIISCKYCLSVEFATMVKILEKETKQDETLYSKLERISGVDDIQYNRHFGSYVWFSIDTESDQDKTIKTIEQTIINYL